MERNELPLDRVPLFEGIDEADANGLLECLKARVCAYQKGDYIPFDRSGEPYVGIVLSGVVHMMKEDVRGQQVLITYFGKGEVFGETLALHREGPSYVSFLAAQPSRVLFLSMRHLPHPCRKQCPYHLTLAQNMINLMSRKNAQLMERLEIISKKSLRKKILTYLSLQSQKQGGRYFTSPLNRTEMASYLQSNRSAMTRELADMKADGLIDFDGDTFALKQ